MVEKKINLEEILLSQIQLKIQKEGYSFGDIDRKWVLKAMLEFGKQLLELAAENANCNLKGRSICNLNELHHGCIVTDNIVVIINKQSILDTIKQIE